MIANTDWSARKMHNSKLYQRIEDEAYLTIPYDFDYAGIINNEYAVDGIARAQSNSSAIGLSATNNMVGAPRAIVLINKETTTTTQP